MEPDTAFPLAGMAAMTGWLPPHRRLTIGSAAGLPGAPVRRGSLPRGDGALHGVRCCARGPGARFRLRPLVGGWIVRDARARSVPHLAVLPCRFLTLMLGPVALLTWLVLRLVAPRLKGALA